MTDTQEQTGLGNYFVANYPPFSAWKPAYLPEARAALESAPRPGTPLGLYLHIPFCRKRCKFCYFRVYTDKNARDVETYVDALLKEVALYSRLPIVGSRSLQFVYFGGGTPSYLSAAQLRALFARLHGLLSWENAEEITFECEPGTLQQHKLEALKELGITRLGRLRLQRDGQGRLPGLQRLHHGQGQGDVPLRLSRQPLARRRHVRHRRRVVRPRQRRPRAERRCLGNLRRDAESRRVAAGPG